MVLIFLINIRQKLCIETCGSIVAHTPLFLNDLTFCVYFLTVESDGAAPVAEYKEYGVHEILVGCLNIVDVVDSLVESGVGVDVGTETQALGLQIVEHVLARIVLCAVEGHVLQEVGEA